MVKYSREPAVPTKAAKARGKDMRVHFKNTYEVADAIRGMKLEKAIQYLKDVIEHKQCIPFRKYAATIGRTAQAHPFHVTQGSFVTVKFVGRWPKKSCQHVLELLENAKSNAEAKGLDIKKTYITHSQVNKAPKGRRRSFKAHGRIKGKYKKAK
jgi:large subunit ribosomal protein L17e